MVTGISFSILVMVSLVGVRYIWAIVQIVLVSILIYVLVAVTLVSYTVIICVQLKEYKIYLDSWNKRVILFNNSIIITSN